jgi:hypothetical protein
MPVAQSPQLVVPFAACAGESWLQAMKSLPPDSLRNLGKLLQGMKLVDTSAGEALSLSTPHERVLAQALGLNDTPDGLIPWAALEAMEKGMGRDKAWAFITPCHWTMGREHATMTDPAALGMMPEQSQTLLAAMQPYFETEGITLHYAAPERWLAEGEIFRQLATASLDRVLGRNVDPWLPGSNRPAGRSAGPPQARPAPSGGSALHEVKSVGAICCADCKTKCRCCCTRTRSTTLARRAACGPSTPSGSAAPAHGVSPYRRGSAGGRARTLAQARSPRATGQPMRRPGRRLDEATAAPACSPNCAPGMPFAHPVRRAQRAIFRNSPARVGPHLKSGAIGAAALEHGNLRNGQTR